MEGLAIGNLTDSMSEDYEGEFNAMSRAVNDSITNLKQMVSEILSGHG